ncbi:transposable element Tc3 transposase [Elysia marginata]|uniref:Transposable element Tc3 transposase n=1 Tax=Elysia marginata TaxID=1093978 RepID=A0AAV4EJJ9_9GAST|nr:transposable element Tc3 transposase [Elysia marginata]
MQQDGAISHTSRVTQRFLNDQVVGFISKDDWPPESPDLNAMWDSIAEKVYMGWSITFTENELKAKIKECWKQIGIEQVRKPIATWRKRVRAVVQLEGSTDPLKNWLR